MPVRLIPAADSPQDHHRLDFWIRSVPRFFPFNGHGRSARSMIGEDPAMAASQSDTEELELLRAAAGEDEAAQRLLARHREPATADGRRPPRSPADRPRRPLGCRARGPRRRRSGARRLPAGASRCRSTPGCDSSPGSGCCSTTATTLVPSTAASVARCPGTWPCPITRPMPWPIA